jgi:hypothetical protein
MPNEPVLNEPLAVPELLAALPDPADYDAVHAALTATAHGRRFLAEFAARNRHADTTPIVAAIARVEAAIRAEGAPQASPRAGELVEIAAALDRIQTAMAAGAPPPSKLVAASERLQDLAFMLHERGVDAPLRDALDAAVAELAAAAAEASDRSAVALLHALASRVAEMIGARGAAPAVASAEELPLPTQLFAMAAGDGEAFAQAVASLAEPAAAEALPVTAPPVEAVGAATAPAAVPEEPHPEQSESGQGAEAPTIEVAAAPAPDAAESQPAAATEPDPAAAAAPPPALEVSDSAAILSEAFGDDLFVAKEPSPAAAPTPAPDVDRVEAAEQAPPPDEAAAPAQDVAAPEQEATAPAQQAVAAPAQPAPAQDAAAIAQDAAAPAQDVASHAAAGPEEDPADLFETAGSPPPDSTPLEASAADADGHATDAVGAVAAELPPAPRVVPPPPLRAIPRPPLSDPLAAVRDLSDEERIALFS